MEGSESPLKIPERCRSLFQYIHLPIELFASNNPRAGFVNGYHGMEREIFSMGYSVTKEFRFEAAHRLARGYVGKCAHNHGHSWCCRVTLAGRLNAVGMVRDFASLKPLREWVDENLDHATLLCSEDDAMLKFVRDTQQRHYVFEGNPTSENLCRFLYEKAKEFELPVVAVEIDETCTSTARYEDASWLET